MKRLSFAGLLAAGVCGLFSSPLAALPDLTLQSSDIQFSMTSPEVTEVITISATIRNTGTAYHDQVVSTPIALHETLEGINEAGTVISADSLSPTWLAQLIVSTQSAYVGKTSFRVRDLGASDDITLEIRQNAGALPGTGSANLLDTIVLDSTNTASPYEWQDFILSAPLQITANTTYWFCLENFNSNGADGYGVWRDSGTASNQIVFSHTLGASWLNRSSSLGNRKLFHRIYKVQETIVRFYLGDPDAGGTLLGTTAIAQPISAGSATTVSISASLAVSGTACAYDIFVRVDGDNLINESNEMNNKASKSITFQSFRDRTTQHVITGSDGQTRLELEPSLVPYAKFFACLDDSPVISSTVKLANSKTLQDQDAFTKPILSTLRQATLFQGTIPSTEISAEEFSGKAKLTIPYSENGSGFVVGTDPGVREDSLSMYWLNETDNLWVRLPDSTVDTAQNTVTATVPHLSYFVLMGLNAPDLSRAYAYPVPFRPNAGLGHSRIKFTGLSPQCVIKIYTVTGELVKSIEESDGDGFNDTWDASDVASGTYLYVIDNATERKTGQLVIIK